ncbi:metallocarboxypeptidase [Ascochyta rabiei]|uniref:Metallocarboxypeptidase n=1 Tax=Didymella rabiei TaxID=5454 RepID=A0A162VVY4_DIDRA|nr:metallocarboxypeptidase [Ascochyta rabiei]
MRFVLHLALASLAAGVSIRSPSERLAKLSHNVWESASDHIDVAIPRHEVARFEALGLNSRVLHADLGASIASEAEVRSYWKRQDYNTSGDWFDSYHPYEDHIEYFKQLQESFPENSNWTSSGTSYEGRDIYGIHMWGADGPGKPAVLWHGTVHAREWIVAPTLEYITKQLVDGYKSGDNLTQTFLNSYDFYIFPIVNPDAGFVHTQTTDRLWRKNRQPPPATAANQTCYGRDINRNWEHNWDANTRGASDNECSQTYRGVRPRDAPENAAMDDFLRNIRDEQGIKLYIDWHSYSQLILCPFGHNEYLYAPELGRWTRAASLMSQEIAANSTNQTTYTFGPSGAVLYPTTGVGVDHVYAVGRAEWSYTIELPDTGDFGFVLPPERIRPTVEESWVGQKVLLSLLDETFFDGEGPAIFY